MTIYIGGRVTARHRLLDTRRQIQLMGHVCKTTWLDTARDYNDPTDTVERLLGEVQRDLEEAGECDLLIIDTIDESKTGGREWEAGFFDYRRRVLKQQVQLWRVGPWRNLFHLGADKAFEGWEECLAELDKLGREL